MEEMTKEEMQRYLIQEIQRGSTELAEWIKGGAPENSVYSNMISIS